MSANRHQRRRAQAEHRHSKNLGAGIACLSSSGPMRLEIIPASRALLDPEYVYIARDFIGRLTQPSSPQCLLCDLVWTPEREPPSAFALVTTAAFFRSSDQPSIKMASPICGSCFADPDFAARCVETYRRDIWPRLTTHDVRHLAPEGVQ